MSHLPGVQLHPRLPPRFVHGVPGEDLWRRRGSGCPDSRALHLTLLGCFPLCFQREDMLARSGAPRRRGWRGVDPRAAGQHQLLLSGALSSERRAGPLGVGALVRPHASSPGCSPSLPDRKLEECSTQAWELWAQSGSVKVLGRGSFINPRKGCRKAAPD